jgi:hypothetical protein
VLPDFEPCPLGKASLSRFVMKITDFPHLFRRPYRPNLENSLAILGKCRLERPTVKGEFLYVGNKKFWVRGVPYGTFRLDSEGHQYNEVAVERDFAQIAATGFNAVRTYTVPPHWFLDAALLYGLRVMVDIPWEQHIAFLENKDRTRLIEERVRAGVRVCAGHPTVLCYAIGNEDTSRNRTLAWPPRYRAFP